MARDRRKINVKGGGIIRYREIYPTPSNPFVDLGYISESEMQDIYNMITSKDDAGHKIDFKEAGQEVIWKTKLLQTSKLEIDFQKNAATKYFEIYIPVLLNNGSTQEISMPICRLKVGFASLSFKPGERTIDIEIHALVPEADFVRDPVNYNITKNVPYVLIENAVAIGEPVDDAVDVAAAILAP